MKLFSIFIALIVLGLSIKPCCSSISINYLDSKVSNSVSCCEDKACTDNNTKNENSEPENKNNGCDFCSPFFTCGGCSGFTFQDNIILLNSLFLKQPKLYSYYNVQFNSVYFGKMWQPPKIKFNFSDLT